MADLLSDDLRQDVSRIFSPTATTCYQALLLSLRSLLDALGRA